MTEHHKDFFERVLAQCLNLTGLILGSPRYGSGSQRLFRVYFWISLYPVLEFNESIPESPLGLTKDFFERVLAQYSNLAPKGANLTGLILGSLRYGWPSQRLFEKVLAQWSNLTGLILESSRYGSASQRLVETFSRGFLASPCPVLEFNGFNSQISPLWLTIAKTRRDFFERGFSLVSAWRSNLTGLFLNHQTSGKDFFEFILDSISA